MKKSRKKECAYEHAIHSLKRKAIRYNDLSIYNEDAVKRYAASWLRCEYKLTISDFEYLLKLDNDEREKLNDDEKLIYECLELYECIE